MKDYYETFLQTKISGNVLGSEVSKVSKGQIFDERKAFDTFDTPLPEANPRNFYLERERQNSSLTERLNAMIAAGTSFDVSIDGFQTCGADNLSEAEKEFLIVNKIAVLCTLQHGLLVKHLFSQKPELRQTFVTKVEERGADYEVVREITAQWFARLLDTMSDRGDNFINYEHENFQPKF